MRKRANESTSLRILRGNIPIIWIKGRKPSRVYQKSIRWYEFAIARLTSLLYRRQTWPNRRVLELDLAAEIPEDRRPDFQKRVFCKLGSFV